jgi:hypothetical protein
LKTITLTYHSDIPCVTATPRENNHICGVKTTQPIRTPLKNNIENENFAGRFAQEDANKTSTHH